jgi:ubiquinone/menaquinone biosynthesis C-methylase UbiE
LSHNTPKFDVQVSTEHYRPEEYDSVPRFISYFYQTNLSAALKPETVLEIGIGNKMVGNYLKGAGMRVTLCDFDPELEPDVVADVRELPLPDASFDLVMACEILEHIPFDTVPQALAELHRVSRKHVLISVPFKCILISLAGRFPVLKRFTRFGISHINIRIPYFWQKHRFDGQHYWEIGMKGSSLRQVRELLRNHGFRIVEERVPVLNGYHHFFVMEKI